MYIKYRFLTVHSILSNAVIKTHAAQNASKKGVRSYICSRLYFASKEYKCVFKRG